MWMEAVGGFHHVEAMMPSREGLNSCRHLRLRL